MTPNKQFNTYKGGLDLEFLREYCMEHDARFKLLLQIRKFLMQENGNTKK